MVDTRSKSYMQLRSRAVKIIEVEDASIPPPPPLQRKRPAPVVLVDLPRKRRKNALTRTSSVEVVAQMLFPDSDVQSLPIPSAPSTSRNTRVYTTEHTRPGPAEAESSNRRRTRPARNAKVPPRTPVLVAPQALTPSTNAPHGTKRKRVQVADEPCESDEEAETLVDSSRARSSRSSRSERSIRALRRKLRAAQDERRAQLNKNEALEVEVQHTRAEVRRVRRKIDVKEQDLAARENNLRIRQSQLDEREQSLVAREVNNSDAPLAKAERTLELLEDKYTCALCFDVIACPYSLTPPRCGHTFCALCILRWFLTDLCAVCRKWHKILECPLCRAKLPVTSRDRPRPAYTCPFTPNRTMDGAVRGLIDELSVALASQTSAENVEGSRNGNIRKPKKRRLLDVDSAPVEGWQEGGPARSEWANRDRIGRHNMDTLTNKWCSIRFEEFVTLKGMLGIR